MLKFFADILIAVCGNIIVFQIEKKKFNISDTIVITSTVKPSLEGGFARNHEFEVKSPMRAKRKIGKASLKCKPN